MKKNLAPSNDYTILFVAQESYKAATQSPQQNMPRKNLLDLIRFRTTPEFKRRVRRLAKSRQCDISDLARQALIDYIEVHEAKLSAPGAK